jgi:catechol 2,3-dioxygenase-like lactoylglutathione lyase family enzyme
MQRSQEMTMIGRLNHVAIAVRDIAKAADVYRRTLGAQVSQAAPQPEHGVTTVFITLPNTKIELIEPLGAASPIAKFLERNPRVLRSRRYSRCAGQSQGARCEGARRWRGEDGCPWEARAVPAPEGLLRHAHRARAGIGNTDFSSSGTVRCGLRQLSRVCAKRTPQPPPLSRLRPN